MFKFVVATVAALAMTFGLGASARAGPTLFPTRHLYVGEWNSNIYYRGQIAVFPTSASGDAAPEYTLGGAATGLWSPRDMTWDPHGNLYVVDESWHNSHGTSFGCAGMYEFAPGSKGEMKPIRRIVGQYHTGLCYGVGGIALDSAGNAYISALYSGEIEVFGPHQHGDVAPLRRFTTGNYPAYIRNDGADHLYVQFGFSPQISEYDLNGQLLSQIQAPGNLSAFGLGNGLVYLPTWDGLNTLSVVRLSDHTTLYSFPYPKYAFWSASADGFGTIFVLYEPPRPKHLPSAIRVYPPGAMKPSREISGLHTTLTSYGVARVGP